MFLEGEWVFVPFLGDFLSIIATTIADTMFSSFRPLSWGLSFNFQPRMCSPYNQGRFRPLSWGLSFNGSNQEFSKVSRIVFVPFLGDFLSITGVPVAFDGTCSGFSSPFLGTFFQLGCISRLKRPIMKFSSPFLGTFFQYGYHGYYEIERTQFSSPFLGTFFQ